jgi:hypothetical protein
MMIAGHVIDRDPCMGWWPGLTVSYRPYKEILERQLSFHLDAHGVGRLAFRSLAVRYFLQILCVPMHKAAVLSTDAGWSNSRER